MIDELTIRFFSTLILLFLLLNCRSQEIEKTNADAEATWQNKIEWQQKQEPDNYKKFRTVFVDIFNSDSLRTILEHASVLLLEDTDAEKLVGFLNFFKNDNGKIKTMRFKYFDRRKQRDNTEYLAVYFLEFENNTQWEFRVGVSEQLQMTRYIITDNNYNEDLPLIESKTPLMLPFERRKQWDVLWGGVTQEDNYHVTSRAQKNAIDFVIRHPWSKKTYRTDGKTNRDYYAFGQPIYAPGDGEVVAVIDNVKDNMPGEMNREDLTGNTVIIKSEEGEYILLAHLKENSIRVKENEQIEAGTLLGLCGNSGNSSEPHLHMHVMDAPSLKEATGRKMFFESLILNGRSRVRNYSPVSGNTVSRR